MQSKTASNLCINMWRRKNKQRRVLCTVSIYKSLQYLLKFLLQYQITFPFSSIFSPSNFVYSLSLYTHTHIYWDILFIVQYGEKFRSTNLLFLTCWLSYVCFGWKRFYFLLHLLTHNTYCILIELWLLWLKWISFYLIVFTYTYYKLVESWSLWFKEIFFLLVFTNTYYIIVERCLVERNFVLLL